MNLRIFIVLLLTLFFFPSLLLSQSEYSNGGNNDNEKNIFVKVGEDDANYTGDLFLNLPVLTVPGRNGFDYNIKLDYSSVIRFDQKASWVGYGFNLSPGSITRSVVCRPDDQSTSVFTNNNYKLHQAADQRQGMMFLGGVIDPDDDKEAWDTYFLNTDALSSRIIPIVRESEPDYGANDIGRVKFYTHNHKPIEIEYNIRLKDDYGNSTIGQPFMDYQLDNFFPNFRVSMPDGVRYIFNERSMVSISGSNGGSDWWNYAYPSSWDLTAMLSPDYVDNGIAGPDDSDDGSWIKFVYSTFVYTPNLNEDGPHDIEAITLGSSTYTNSLSNHTTFTYEYKVVNTIETPTHRAVFGHEPRDNSHGGRRRLLWIQLIDKKSGKEIKKINFSYGTTINNGATEWRSGYSLRGNQDALQSLNVATNYYDGLGRTYNALYSFEYNYNPAVSYDNQYGTEFPNPSESGVPWALYKIIYPNGGNVTYEYEYDKVNWFWNVGEAGGNLHITYFNQNPELFGSSRLKKIKVDDNIEKLKTYEYSFSYGEGFKNHPTYFQVNSQIYNYITRYTGNIGYRDVTITLANGRGGIKKYFTTGVKPEEPIKVIYNGTPNRPVDDLESHPSEYYTNINTGYTFKDNSPRQGLVWKKEYLKPYSNNSIKTDSYKYIMEDLLPNATNNGDPKNRYKIFPCFTNKNIDTVKQDGVTKISIFDNEKKNGLPNSIRELSQNMDDLRKFKRTFSNSNLLSSVGMDAIHMYDKFELDEVLSPNSTNEFAVRQEWESIYPDDFVYTWYRRIYPTRLYKWRESTATKTFVGTTDPDLILINEKEYDRYGNVVKEHDANGNYTLFKYGFKGSRILAKITNVVNTNIPILLEDFNDGNLTTDADPQTWVLSNMQSNYRTLKSTGTGYAGINQNFGSSDSYTIEVALRINNDNGNSGNWAGVHIKCTDMSNYNSGFLIYYTESGYINLYKNGTILQSVSTGLIPNVWRKLKIVTTSSQVSVDIDGRNFLFYSSSSLNLSGKISLNTDNSISEFDNFRVYPSEGIATTYAYDLYSNLSEEIDGVFDVKSYTYDDANRLTKTYKMWNGKNYLLSEKRYYNSRRWAEEGFSYANTPSYIENIIYNDTSGFSDFNYKFDWTVNNLTDDNFNVNHIYFPDPYSPYYLHLRENCIELAQNSSITRPITSGHTITRVDVYINWDLFEAWNGTKEFAKIEGGGFSVGFVQRDFGGYDVRQEFEVTKNNVTNYYPVDSYEISTGWYTVEIEKNENGEVWVYIFAKGDGRIEEDTKRIYANGFPINWSPNFKSSAGNVKFYLANYYSGLPTISRTYIDGFGREIQKNVMNKNNAIITSSNYLDEAGDLSWSIKPFEMDLRELSNYERRSYVKNYTDAGLSSNYYDLMDESWTTSTQGFAYSVNQYDNNPLKRLNRVSFPGSNWSLNLGHNKIVSYSTNLLSDEIRNALFTNDLFKEIHTDEQGNVTNLYFDKFSKNLVAKKVDPINNGSENDGESDLGINTNLEMETDFYYDVLDNVIKVVDPTLKENLYSYNTAKNLTQKVTSDNGTTKYLYDQLDQIRFVQDASHSGTKNNININNGSGTSVPNTSGSFTLTRPANVYLKAQVIGTVNGRYMYVRIKSGTIYLANILANNTSPLVTQYVYLPKGTYTYEITSYNTGTFVYQILNQSGYEFVYNKYDKLGRVIEIGEYDNANTSTQFSQTNADNTVFPTSNTYLQTRNYYDLRTLLSQRNVWGRLSYSESYRFGTKVYWIIYSYNERGSIEYMKHYWNSGYNVTQNFYYDNAGKLVKKDFIDSNNNSLYTFYEYDQPGRLVKVYTDTNPNGTTKVQEAEYQYFANGSVKRLQLANAQGMDYRYNCRDWLTMINHQNLNSTQDPGHDGNAGITTVDKFGMIIGYNNIDHIGYYQGAQAQHSGNISWLMYNMSTATFNGSPIVGYSFSYDNANRLTGSNFGYYNNAWLPTNAFDENNITYDKAGNFLTLNRYNGAGTVMDQFGYNYYAGTNKLKYVTDAAGSSVSTIDIDNQIPTNYLYDDNGNVYQDYGNNVRFVINDINNLPLKIFKADGSVLEYTYDVNGQRVLNTSSNKYYVNGLNGSNEAIVDRTDNSKITHNLYGLDLIGQVDRVNTTLTRYYYLKDHLGSIRVRVNSLGAVQGYDDYYPFGSLSRSSTTGLDVRYKFTGKERDLATSYDYFGARFYESRLGRWLQMDAVNQYSSPYVYCGNNPLKTVDKNGLYGEDVHYGLTYLMARLVMGASNNVADIIARADQNVDDNFSTSWANPLKMNETDSYHFASTYSESAATTVESASQYLSNEMFGKYLHSFQDIKFAHLGFLASKGGHAGVKGVDDFCENGELKDKSVQLIKAMYEIFKAKNGGIAEIELKDLLELIRSYAKKKGGNDINNIQTIVGGKKTWFIKHRTRVHHSRGAGDWFEDYDVEVQH